MAKNSSRAVGRHFLHIPGPTPLPDRVLRAMDTPIIDHRGPEFAKLTKKCLEGIKTIFKTTQSGDHLHRDRHRRLGSGPGQHAVARRPRADGGDRPVRHAVEEDGGEDRAQARIHRHRLAQRRRSEGDRSQAPRRQEQRDQGGLRPAQRNLDRRADPGRRDPQGDRRRQPSGAVLCRHHFLARLDRLPARRMGRRRLRRRRAEGPDAAARHVVQRHQRQGAGREQDLQDSEIVLGLGRDAGHEQSRLLPLHAGDADDAGPERRHRHAARGRARQRVRPPRTGWPKPPAAR